jgi:DNA-binding LytR/AlgR family response regulator
MTNKIRIVIADDERPARAFLANILRDFEDAKVVAEAENGAEAIEAIKRTKPDLALLDLQMPEIDGIGVVKILKKTQLPLVAFVTAYDEYAVQAFEVNAVDYLLKPVEKSRLRETLNRAHERLEQADFRETESANLKAAAIAFEKNAARETLERIPIRLRDEIFLLPASEVVSIVADGELLHVTTLENKRYTINYRLKDIESRLDAKQFMRLSRNSIVNLEMINKIAPLPGGTYAISLKNGQEIFTSRSQSRILREKLLKL